jgi:hypothetical protein
VLKGDKSFIFNKIPFIIVKASDEGIIATNDGGMGHIIISPFQGGVLVSYAMPQADPHKVLSFLKSFAGKIEENILMN